MSLEQLLRILLARWRLMLVTVLVTVAATIAVSLMLPPRYTSTATLVVDIKGVDPISGAFMPILPMAGYLATQVDIIKSHGVARGAVELLRLPDNASARELYLSATEGKGDIRDFLASNVIGRYLSVDPSRESNVINVSYTGNDPKFAMIVANAVVQSYINKNLELKVAPARQLNTFFNEQIKTLKDNLERAQANLSGYQREKGIIATDERLDVENNRLNDLSTQLVRAQEQTYDSLGRQRQVQDFIAKGHVPDTLPDVLTNPVIQNLKTNLTQLEIKLNDISSKVGRNHPSYQSALAEMESVKQKLLQEMNTIAGALGNSASLAQKREGLIRAALAEQRTKVLRMKEVRDEQTVLLREAENAQRAYDAAMGRMTQTRLESQTSQTNVLVINDAVEPIEPSFPRLTLNVALSIILGSLLAVGIALLRELSDRIVRSEADLVETLDVPVLGMLGRLGDQRGRWWRRPRGGGQPSPLGG
ncbi:MAG: chain length determinant protein EpsF [Burkholderiales bacterium]|nr:chain length determinant protein EpsF [Burkholderiales bacterium]